MNGALTVEGLRCRYRGGPEVIRGVDFSASPGEILTLLGPNGAGKSTLLKAMVGLLPCTGTVRLGGIDLASLSARDRALQVAYVPQRTRLTARLSVRNVVDLGRFAHRGPWARPSRADHAAIDRAMDEADVAHLAERPFPELSGGEQQRVLVARALASEAPAVLLDEPTSSLDVRHALELHGLLRRLTDRGCVVVVVLHDLSEARHHADRAVLLRQGTVFAAGPVDAVVATHPIQQVYGVTLIEGGGLAYQQPSGGDTP